MNINWNRKPCNSLFNKTVSDSDYTVLNGSIISKWWTGKDTEESGHGLIWGTM